MITVLIRVSHGAEALAVTLSALVPAVADGLVADAVILAENLDEDVARVTEAAGATLVVARAGSWVEAAGSARHEWLLCLDDGDLPQEGWIRVLDRFVGVSGNRHERARLRRHQGLRGVLRDAIRMILTPNAIRSGDLLRRDVMLSETKGAAPVRLAAAIARDEAFSGRASRV